MKAASVQVDVKRLLGQSRLGSASVRFADSPRTPSECVDSSPRSECASGELRGACCFEVSIAGIGDRPPFTVHTADKHASLHMSFGCTLHLCQNCLCSRPAEVLPCPTGSAQRPQRTEGHWSQARYGGLVSLRRGGMHLRQVAFRLVAQGGKVDSVKFA